MTLVGRDPPAAPAPAQAGHHAYVFGDCVLDVARGVLLRCGHEVPLRRQSFEVLHHLVRRHGCLVSKKELMQAVWGSVVVTESSLTQCLTDVRRAIGDEDRAAIRTLPRRGYLFDLPVTEHHDLPDPVASRSEDAGDGRAPEVAVGSTTPTAPPPGVRRRMAWGGLAGLAVALGAAWWVTGRDAPPAPGIPSPPEKSIAVLPFTDMSAGGELGYFGDGMAEELINLLAQTPELLVIARTSSFYFRNEPADVSTIGRKLNVAYVLEGSVRQAGERVRVTAQLVRASDGVHVWSQSFDRELGDVLDAQDAIASAVARELHVELAAAAPRKPPDPQAYAHFMQAQYLYNRRSPGDIELAASNYRKAVETDPGFARAWAGLVATYRVWNQEFDMPADTALPLMREAAERALATGPEIGEVQLRAAHYYWAAEDFERAWAHWHRAKALDPQHPVILGNEAGRASTAGDLERAAEIWTRAVARDPMSWVARGNFIHTLIALGRLEDARFQLELGETLHGSDVTSLRPTKVQLALEEGRYEDALALSEGAEDEPARDSWRGMAFDALGRRAEADQALAVLESATDPDSALGAAEVYARRGELERAWQWLETARQRWLERSVAARSHFLHDVHMSPPLAPLRADPRWPQMVEAYQKHLPPEFN